jgi:heme exporter protein D
MDLGPHAVFIWTSYGTVIVVLAALIAWLIHDGRRQQRRLLQLEARGIRRKSAGGGSRQAGSI